MARKITIERERLLKGLCIFCGEERHGSIFLFPCKAYIDIIETEEEEEEDKEEEE